MKFISELNEINHAVYQRIQQLSNNIYAAKQTRHERIKTGQITDAVDIRILDLQLEQDYLINLNADLTDLYLKEHTNND